jgi:hypothetical protein
MFEGIKKFFTPKVIYKLVEVKAPLQRVQWDNNTREAITTLAAHPGFVALQQRLMLQKAQLETTLTRSVHKDLRAIDYLQAGIFWSNWLQDQIEKATVKGSSRQVNDAYDEELRAFQAIDAQIERVGM